MSVDVLRYVLVYGCFAIVGAVPAWLIQGIRLEAARNNLRSYQQAVIADEQQAATQTAKINQETSDAYAKNIMALRAGFAAQRVLPARSGSASAVPAAASRIDAATDDAQSDPAGASPALSEQCAETTLQLISLQVWVKKEAGE